MNTGQDEWIYCCDAMPEDVYPNGRFEENGKLYIMGLHVFAAVRSLTGDREPWVVDVFYHMEAGCRHWGDIPMVSWGEAEVYAWMPKKYPNPPAVPKM